MLSALARLMKFATRMPECLLARGAHGQLAVWREGGLFEGGHQVFFSALASSGINLFEPVEVFQGQQFTEHLIITFGISGDHREAPFEVGRHGRTRRELPFQLAPKGLRAERFMTSPEMKRVAAFQLAPKGR